VIGMEDLYLKRRLTAVLLADVVGYSRLMSVDEEGTHVLLADFVKELIDPKIAEHHGRLIRTMGDGFLAEFDSAVDAVRCGVDIQRGLTEQGASLDINRRIQLRIGINTGDVIVDDRDIYGNSVNIAARLEGLAEPGEIYVTRSVRDQLRGYPSLAFEDRGERLVKNIDQPIRVFRVEHGQNHQKRALLRVGTLGGRRFNRAILLLRRRSTAAIALALAVTAVLAMAALPFWRDSPPLAPGASIVVLPFNNFSNDPGQDYFADAVTDDVTTDLGRQPGIFVIARGTAFTYKGRAVDARQIGRECGVRYLLEGSIRRLGSKVETNAQLIDAVSGAQIWADRFDNEVTDLFELESTVTGRIASALDIQLVRAEGRRATDERATNPDAIDLRVRAMSLYFGSITPEHSQEARRYLEEAVRRDPQSAEAWGWLAEIAVSQYLHRWNSAGKKELSEAADAIRNAFAIDPNLAQPYYAEGLVRRAKGEHHAALEAFSRALELDPNLPRALAEKGNELILLGRPEEALPAVEKAIKLSPRDPSLGGYYWIIGRAHFFTGSYGDAIPWLRKSIALRPNDWFNRLYLVSAYALNHQEGEAKKVLQEFNNNPQFTGYTLERVASNEKASPNDNAVVVSARHKLHEGLQIAGMAAR
jgi:adenylate cyclase